MRDFQGHRIMTLKNLSKMLLPLSIAFPLTTQAAADVEMKKGDFKGTVATEIYHVYDGTLDMNGSFDFSGTRSYSNWQIKYADENVCKANEINDDAANGPTGDLLVQCGDYMEIDSGYTIRWLDDPQSDLKIGLEHSSIIGANGIDTYLHWTTGSVYRIKLYGNVYWGTDDSAHRDIMYMGKPKMMVNTASVKEELSKAKLTNTVGYDQATGDRTVSLYFFPAVPADYVIKSCVAQIDAGDQNTVLDNKYFNRMTDIGAALLSFKLNDAKIGNVDTISVTSTCNFERNPKGRALGTISDKATGSVTYKVNVKEKVIETEKIIDHMIEVIKTINHVIDRPILDNLFATTLNSGKLKITGEVARLFNADEKENKLDSAKDLTYFLGTSSENNPPVNWSGVSELGGKISFSPSNHTFSITGIDSQKLLKGSDKVWIKVAGGSADKRVESVPQTITLRLADNADLEFLPPDDKKEMLFCKHNNDQLSNAHILIKLDLRQAISASLLELSFNNLDKVDFLTRPFASIHAISPTASISGSRDLNIDLDRNKISASTLSVNMDNKTLSAGQYEILIPLMMLPRQDKVSINSTLWGGLVNSRSEKVERLQTQGITYEFSAEQCK